MGSLTVCSAEAGGEEIRAVVFFIESFKVGLIEVRNLRGCKWIS
jgi:hypothetical protein